MSFFFSRSRRRSSSRSTASSARSCWTSCSSGVRGTATNLSLVRGGVAVDVMLAGATSPNASPPPNLKPKFGVSVSHSFLLPLNRRDMMFWLSPPRSCPAHPSHGRSAFLAPSRRSPYVIAILRLHVRLVCPGRASRASHPRNMTVQCRRLAPVPPQLSPAKCGGVGESWRSPAGATRMCALAYTRPGRWHASAGSRRRRRPTVEAPRRRSGLG